MPIYEYVCLNCEEEFEKLVYGEPDCIECPGCAGTQVRKKPSVFGFTSSGKFSSSVAGAGCTGCNASPSKCSSCK